MPRCLYLGLIALLVGCSSDTKTTESNDKGAIVFERSSEDGSVAGQWSAKDLPTVRFESVKIAEGAYEATLQVLPEGKTVQVSLSSPDQATVSWDGVELDGLGGLQPAEEAALIAMNQELGDLLALPLLTLACAEHEGDPGAVAALLVPYQLVSKYLVVDRAAEAERLAASSPCGFGFASADPSSPRSNSISLMVEDPVPSVWGFFPFDATGAAEMALFSGGVPGVRHGPCGSRCRGACGPDCPTTCDIQEEWRCLDDGERLTGVAVLETIYTCGTHEGCRWHDQCFDDCNATHGCGSWAASTCMHVGIVGCDSQAALQHGAANCWSWKDGGGPFDGELVYTYPTETTKSDAKLCPPSDEPFSFKMPVEHDESLAGMDLEFSIEGGRVTSTQQIGTAPSQKLQIYGEPAGDTLRVTGRASLGKADSIGFLRLYLSTTEPPHQEHSWTLEDYEYIDFAGEIPIINNVAHFTIQFKRDSQHTLEVDARFPWE